MLHDTYVMGLLCCIELSPNLLKIIHLARSGSMVVGQELQFIAAYYVGFRWFWISAPNMDKTRVLFPGNT